jgi:hypothetical protein
MDCSEPSSTMYSTSTIPAKSSGNVQLKKKADMRWDLNFEVTPNVQKMEHTSAGSVYHLSSSARAVGRPCPLLKGILFIIILQGMVILPQKLVEHNRNDNVMRLVGSYWIEHLIYDRLVHLNLPPILSHYYSEGLMKEHYDRAELEVKLYGDAIAKAGLALSAIQSGKLGQGSSLELGLISYIHHCRQCL